MSVFTAVERDEPVALLLCDDAGEPLSVTGIRTAVINTGHIVPAVSPGWY